MKTIQLILIFLLTVEASVAQEYKTSFESNSSENFLDIMIEGGEIKVEGYSGEEIIIAADGYEAPPEKAKGLTALYANGRQDNSGIGLSVTKEGSKVQLISVGHQDIDYNLKVPDQTTIRLQAGPRNDDIYIQNIKGEIELKAHSEDVELAGISGPVVANSISGDIKLDFTQINTNKPIAISVVSGDVDMYLPSESKVDFKLSSISGEVYTDFNLNMSTGDRDREESYGVRKPIHGSINGGGTPIHISTISGNIYLRKK